ncbi:MAG: hypothetical protein ACK52I_37830 [Pseudomonadota bacterium]|jgi:bifunctional pyridoxal-dependent enzyme with beta-cystathionase and maltose regulon repressor activities
MIPHIIAAAAVGIAIAGVTGYVYGRSDGVSIEQARQLAAKASREEALSQVADVVSKMQVVNKTITQRVERETIEKPVYRDCVNTPDGMQLINEALTGRPGSAGGGELPRTDRATGP